LYPLIIKSWCSSPDLSTAKFLLPYLQANSGPDGQHIQQEENLKERIEEKIAATKVELLIENVARKNKESSEQESDAQVSFGILLLFVPTTRGLGFPF
jgi:hypothetical protein